MPFKLGCSQQLPSPLSNLSGNWGSAQHPSGPLLSRSSQQPLPLSRSLPYPFPMQQGGAESLALGVGVAVGPPDARVETAAERQGGPQQAFPQACCAIWAAHIDHIFAYLAISVLTIVFLFGILKSAFKSTLAGSMSARSIKLSIPKMVQHRKPIDYWPISNQCGIRGCCLFMFATIYIVIDIYENWHLLLSLSVQAFFFCDCQHRVCEWNPEQAA